MAETPERRPEQEIVSAPSALTEYVRDYALARQVMQYLLSQNNLAHQGATIGVGIEQKLGHKHTTLRVVRCCEKLVRLGGAQQFEMAGDKPSFACTDIGRQTFMQIQNLLGEGRLRDEQQ